jgi:hypothetical protein
MTFSRLMPLLLIAGLASAPVHANDFALLPGAPQGDIRDITRDLTAALSPKALSPAEATGVIGFGVGAFGTRTSTRERDAWQGATGDRLGSISMVGLTLAKGLPAGIDIAAFYADVLSTDARMVGGEIRYAILPGSTVMPAVATRLAYAHMSGNDDFGFNALSADVAVSKGFAMLTPYAGAGLVRGQIRPDTANSNESVTAGRVFVGARLSLGLIQLTPEVERIGSSTSTSLRIGISL